MPILVLKYKKLKKPSKFLSKYLTFRIIVRLGASRSTSNLPRRTDRRTRRFLEAKAGILYRDVGVVAGAQGH